MLLWLISCVLCLLQRKRIVKVTKLGVDKLSLKI